jgi:predicted HicB family RNase H-like nuclease
MKKPNLSQYHKSRRDKRVKEIRTQFGKDILNLVNSGSTIGEIVSFVNLPIKIIRYYLEQEGLYETTKQNWKLRRVMVAQSNGKKSSNTLAGVHLKPLTDEIKTWFVEQLRLGKFQYEVSKELKEKFQYGGKKYRQLCDELGYPPYKPKVGKYNAMYGKLPGKSSGIGAKGWIYVNGNKMFFRSSLELKVFLYLDENNIPFTQSLHRIEYTYKNNNRTYCPDIVIGNIIYEIKPMALTKIESVKIKFVALQKYCSERGLQCDYITEHTFPLLLTVDKLDKYISDKKIIVDDNNYNKIVRYL